MWVKPIGESWQQGGARQYAHRGLFILLAFSSGCHTYESSTGAGININCPKLHVNTVGWSRAVRRRNENHFIYIYVWRWTKRKKADEEKIEEEAADRAEGEAERNSATARASQMDHYSISDANCWATRSKSRGARDCSAMVVLRDGTSISPIHTHLTYTYTYRYKYITPPCILRMDTGELNLRWSDKANVCIELFAAQTIRVVP